MLCAAMVPLGWPIAATFPGVERSSPDRARSRAPVSVNTTFLHSFPEFTHVHTSSTSNHHPNPPNPPAHHSTWRKARCVAGRLEVIESTRLGPAKCIQMPHFLLSLSTTFDRSVALLASKNISVAMNVPTSIPSASYSCHFFSISWASAAVRRCLGVSWPE